MPTSTSIATARNRPASPGIPGVTITVANGGTQVTDSNGHYSFANLQADTYSVSAPDPAANKHLFTMSPLDAAVALGEDTPDINFGYVPSDLRLRIRRHQPGSGASAQ
jgi:hypothetical protein